MRIPAIGGALALLAVAVCTSQVARADGTEEVTFKISADVMIRPEIRDEADLDSSTSDEKNFVGQRTRLKVAGSVGDARYVVQLLDGREWGAERKTGTENQVGMVQGYLEFGHAYELRVGRQEITWGKKRLIGSTGWGYKNLAAYDGVRLQTSNGTGAYDAFVVSVAESKTTAADDENLAGFKYAVTGSSLFKPEFYVLYKYVGDDPETPGDESTTMPIPGILGYLNLGTALVVDYECVWQLGTRAGKDHRASFYHLGLNYSFGDGGKYWVATEYNLASGDDDATDGRSETFDKLYGINHSHYGYIDYQDPRNMKDLRLVIGAKLTPKVSAQLEYHDFSLAEARDKWYSRSASVALHDPTGAAGTDVGSEIDVKCKFKLPYKINLELGAAYFKAGDFVHTLIGPTTTDSSWGYVQMKRSF